MLCSLLLALIGAHSVSPSGTNVSFMLDSTKLQISHIQGEILFEIEASQGEYFRSFSSGDSRVVLISSAQGLVEYLLPSGEARIIHSSGAGAPWLSTDDVLWYTCGGWLYRNEVQFMEGIDAYHISVEEDLAAFTDHGDRLHLLDTGTGEETVVSGYRFYAPVVLPGGDVLSPTLSGQIIMISGTGDTMEIAQGEQPFWSEELQGVFFCVSIDDGHMITGADIWFVRPGNLPVQITDTPAVFETYPVYTQGILYFTESATGSPGQLNLNGVDL